MGIFKGKLDANKVFDTVSKGIDKLSFSDQERATMNLGIADKIAEFAGNTLSENTERSKARRVIAYIIIGNVVLLLWAVIILSFLGYNDAASFIQKLATDWQMHTAFIMVLAFFFGGYMMRNIPLKSKQKK